MTTSASDTGDTPTLRLRDPAGVVAAVPYLLGFVPQRSLVAVGVRDGEVAPVLRLDWQPTDSRRTTRSVLARVEEILLRNECTHALLVAWTELDPVQLDVRGLRRTLRLPLASPGRSEPARWEVGAQVQVLDVLVVGPTRFRSLRCQDRACCPAEGSPRTESTHHPVAAEFVLAGRAPHVDRAALASPDTTVTTEERAQAAVGARQAEPGDAALDETALLRTWCELVADDTSQPAPAFAGALAAAWTRAVRLRDACALACLPAGAAGAVSVLGATDASSALAHALRDPGCAGAVARHGRLYHRTAALVPERHRAVVLAAHAWLAWVSGEGTQAVVLAEQAVDLDPGCSLAGLVLRCLEHGIGPEWTTARSGRRGSLRPD